MLRWALPTAVVIMANTAGVADAGVTVTPAERGYDIDIDGQASATELLDAIASATGAAVKGQPEDTTINANHLRSTTLERALRQLLPGAFFTVRFDEDNRPAAIIFLSPDETGDGTSGGSEADTPPADDPSMTGGDGSDPANNGDVQAPQ